MAKIPNAHILAGALGHLLREEREKRGFSKLQLARQSGLTRQCISLFEQGARVPMFFSIFRLASGLGMEAEEFLCKVMEKMEMEK